MVSYHSVTRTRRAIRALAGRLGWPVIAELHSTLRESEQYILEYPDLTTRLLGDPLRREPPQSVLHFGLFPTSKNVQGLLRTAQNVVHVDTRPGLRLPIDGNLSTYRASPRSLLSAVEVSERATNLSHGLSAGLIRTDVSVRFWRNFLVRTSLSLTSLGRSSRV